VVALRLLSVSFRDLSDNFRAASTIAIPALLATAICFAMAFVIVYGILSRGTPTGEVAADGSTVVTLTSGAIVLMIIGISFSICLLVVGFSWTCIAWHRFIDLGEIPTKIVPRWPRKQIVGYAARFVGFVLLSFLFLIPGLVLMLIVGDRDANGSISVAYFAAPFPLTTMNVLASIFCAGLATALALRFSTFLPAFALERSVPGDAKPRPFATVFLPIGILLNAAFVILDLLIQSLHSSLFILLAFAVVQLMVSTSIITRIFLDIAPRLPDTPPASVTTS
jgi:hypothetical protein